MGHRVDCIAQHRMVQGCPSCTPRPDRQNMEHYKSQFDLRNRHSVVRLPIQFFQYTDEGGTELSALLGATIVSEETSHLASADLGTVKSLAK